jgi:TolB protein
VGADGNLYIYERGREPIAVTQDAGNDDSDPVARFYSDPTWSPEGWLSFVQLAFVGGAASVDVLALNPGGSERQTLLSTTDESYVYGYWSPAACSEGPECGRFAFLMSEEGQIGFYLSEVGAGEAQTEQLRVSDSHYYSWAPDGESMLWFRDGEELSVYEVGTDSITRDYAPPFGFFQSPNWSPVDDRLLFAQANNRGEATSRLTVARGTELASVGEAFAGFAAFSWSPDGERIALATGDGIPYGRLRIADAAGGAAVEAAPLSDILAFFWAPDGEKLAVVTIEEAGDNFEARRFSRHRQDRSLALVWHLVDATTGEVTRLAEFLPTQDQLYALQFFDQYAQSHQVWSPDSRYIAYAGVADADATPMISIIDTQNPTLPPQMLTEGRSAVFSFK